MWHSKLIKLMNKMKQNKLHHISLLTSTRIQKNRSMKQQVGLAYYRPQQQLWKGNVFTSICQELFCPREEFCPGGGVYTDRQTPPSRHSTLCRHPPLPSPPPQMATAADGTHPTGMHSCYKNLGVYKIERDGILGRYRY